MRREEIVMVCCCDIAGQVRGKGMPAAELEARRQRGVGWTPTNIMITAFNDIAPGPWGAFGDLVLLPDLATHLRVDFGDDGPPEQFVLGDIRHLDGRPWECCPRDFLRRGLTALADEFGLSLKAAFEHELHYDRVEERPNAGYALDAYRRQGAFGEVFFHAMRQAGLEPDTFMAEYGPAQYEVTIGHQDGLGAADQAVILREMARASAHRLGGRASFTPILRPEAVGNGVHVHFSLWAGDDQPVMHAADGPGEIGPRAGAFAAGILAKLPAILALTAASPISYLRLTPNRWSASYDNLGLNDREAAVRICPVFETMGVARERQFHLEFRAADAAASPYMLLGAIVWSGLWGLRGDLPTPTPTTEDPSQMAEDRLAELGLQRLPLSLTAALDNLAGDDDIKAWLGPQFHEVYLGHKRFEIGLTAHLNDAARCERYRWVY
ncbi:MAG: glutamine synthetase family protein [Alphaproteobacteria bacterium]|jgi:glutamine synthetase|nr:glutamine synthetase family protein [Alphaproteobacteria bacterium]MDP6566784.1 glutamine synthetase family protein [Alphaproteobacteria bacterium]MDP6812284.1 glutamine synthetase family protein [Alphaproteobacteria bacterium]